MPGPSTTEPNPGRRRAPRRQGPQTHQGYQTHQGHQSNRGPRRHPTHGPAALVERHQQRVAHDIGHTCGTVLMLAAALESTPGLDAEARRFARQLATETRRMIDMTTELLRAPDDRWTAPTGPATVRLDTLIESIADPIRSTSRVHLDVRVAPVTVGQEPLALWRALRNLICNALQAVDVDGRIRIELTTRGRFAVVDVDDDGPGLGDGPARAGGFGLGIVQDVAAAAGGWFELGPGPLGGCRARLIVPHSTTTASPADGTGYADRPL